MNEEHSARRRENSGNERLSDKKYFKVVLAAGIIALTVFLMIFFKQNPDGIRKLVAEQGENLVSFYTNNLQPALLGSKLTVSDVFNFAVNDNLPIDKDNNTSLYVGSASNGTEMLELRSSQAGTPKLNYDNFKKEANLNRDQERRLDSILISYKPQIESLILANDDNTIAVNANLWNINKYILIDIVRFLKEEDKSDFLNNVMPQSISDLDWQMTQIKNVGSDDYVFIAPDTVFSMKYNYSFDQEDLDEMRDEALETADAESIRMLKMAVKNIKANSEHLNKQRKHNIMAPVAPMDHNNVKFQFDSSLIPPDAPEIPGNISFKIEAVKDKLKELSMKFGSNIMEITEDRVKMKFYSEEGDPSFSFDLDISGMEGLSEEMMKLTDSLSSTGFNMNIDINDTINKSAGKSKEKTKAKSKSRSY